MRSCLVFALLFSFTGACGTGPTTPGDDDDMPPDDLPPPPERGFRVITPDIEIAPGDEITYCYYFRTPNTEPMAINHWKSEMTPGSHHMIMYTTNNDAKPPGTVSDQECGFGGGQGTDVPKWTYSAQTPSAELELPGDDGAGQPLAQDIPPNTAAYFQMHYLNATDEPIQVHVTLDAFALDAGATYTKTAPYITFNGNISIPPGAVGDVESQSCNTPAGSKFWLMSTHAHKQAVKTRVLDGTTEVFASTDWEHPGAAMFMTPSEFYSFSTGKLTYECTYNNTGDNAGMTVSTGDSAQDEEMCMAAGYYFPANKALFCYNNFGPF